MQRREATAEQAIPTLHDMMRFLKWFFCFFVAVLLVVVAAAYWYVTPQRLRGLVQPLLSSALGRAVTFDRIDWGLFDGMVVSGLRVENRAELGTDPLLVADRAQVYVSPRAWLWGDGWLGELVLEGAVLAVGKRRAGEPKHAPVKIDLLPIDRVRIRDGTLQIENRPSGCTTVVSGINGRVRGLKSHGALALDSDLAAEQVAICAARDTSHPFDKLRIPSHASTARAKVLRDLRVSGQVILSERDPKVMTTEGLTVGIGPFFAQLSGTIRDPWRAFVVDLRGEDQMLDIVPVRTFLMSSGLLPKDATLTGQGRGDVAVSGRWPFRVRAHIAFDDLVLDRGQAGATPLVFRHFKMALHAKNARLHVGPVSGQVCEGTLEGSLALENGQWNGSVSLVNARAERVLQSAGWRIPVAGAVDITANILDGAVASGRVQMADARVVKWDFLQQKLRPVEQLGLLTADEVPLRDVDVVFRLHGNAVILEGTKLVAADMACTVGGQGTLDGQLNYVLDVAVPASRIKVAGFHIGALFGRLTTIPVRVKIGGTTNAPAVTVEIP